MAISGEHRLAEGIPQYRVVVTCITRWIMLMDSMPITYPMDTEMPSCMSPGWSHLRIRTSIQLRACRKVSLEAMEQQRTMHSMRAGEKRAFNARYSRDCSCVAQSSVPFMVSKCMCGPAKTRAICAKVSMQCLSYVTWGPYSIEKEASFNKMMTLKSLDFG